MTYVGVPVTPIALPSAWSASTISMCRPSISAVSNSSASRPSSRGHLDQQAVLPRGPAPRYAPSTASTYGQPWPCSDGLLGGLRGGVGVLVLLQREVPQPHLQPVAVARAQGAQVVQGAVAVRALELAPDVEDGAAGRAGEESFMAAQSPSTGSTRPTPRAPRAPRPRDRPDRDLGRSRPGDVPEVGPEHGLPGAGGAGWKGRS